jgi:hypothetical protein
MQNIARKRLKMVCRLHQRCQDGVRIDREDAGHSADAEAFGCGRYGPHQHVGVNMLALKLRPMGLLEVAVTRHTLQLPPWFAAWMTVGANVAASRPAIIGAVLARTEPLLSVNRALASSRGGERRRRGTQCPGVGIGRLLTGGT